MLIGLTDAGKITLTVLWRFVNGLSPPRRHGYVCPVVQKATV